MTTGQGHKLVLSLKTDFFKNSGKNHMSAPLNVCMTEKIFINKIETIDQENKKAKKKFQKS